MGSTGELSGNESSLLALLGGIFHFLEIQLINVFFSMSFACSAETELFADLEVCGSSEDRLSTLKPSQIKGVTYGLGLQSLSCVCVCVTDVCGSS